MLHAFVTAAAEETQSPVLPSVPDLIWGTLAFAIVLGFFIWKILPTMNKLLDARADAIQGGMNRADEAQAKATAALEEYTAKLADARGEAAAIRDQDRPRSRTGVANRAEHVSVGQGIIEQQDVGMQVVDGAQHALAIVQRADDVHVVLARNLAVQTSEEVSVGNRCHEQDVLHVSPRPCASR